MEDSPGGSGSVTGPSVVDQGRRSTSLRGVHLWLMISCASVIPILLGVPAWYSGSLPGIGGPPVVRITPYCGAYLSSLSFNYSGPDQGYLSPENIAWPDYCFYDDVAPSSTYKAFLFIHNGDTLHSHSINSISMGGPFGLAGTSPPLPEQIPMGGNLTLSLTIYAPASPGFYGLPSAIVYAS
jgi:hypothetical protein